MLSCREATALMSQEQDRPLAWSERWALQVHVWMCRGCSEFRRQMRILSQACARFRGQFDEEAEARSPTRGSP